MSKWLQQLWAEPEPSPEPSGLLGLILRREKPGAAVRWPEQVQGRASRIGAAALAGEPLAELALLLALCISLAAVAMRCRWQTPAAREPEPQEPLERVPSPSRLSRRERQDGSKPYICGFGYAAQAAVLEAELAEELPLVQEIFAAFDVDCDGKLSKDEYKSYLKGIEAWGDDPYTDKAWDEGWTRDRARLQCIDIDSITKDAFEGILYGEYRVGRAQADLVAMRSRSSPTANREPEPLGLLGQLVRGRSNVPSPSRRLSQLETEPEPEMSLEEWREKVWRAPDDGRIADTSDEDDFQAPEGAAAETANGSGKRGSGRSPRGSGRRSTGGGGGGGGGAGKAEKAAPLMPQLSVAASPQQPALSRTKTTGPRHTPQKKRRGVTGVAACCANPDSSRALAFSETLRSAHDDLGLSAEEAVPPTQADESSEDDAIPWVAIDSASTIGAHVQDGPQP